MFRVENTIITNEIATSDFACDVFRCKGACCVVGDAGAPVSQGEIPVLKKAYRQLRDELRSEARETVERDGLIQGDQKNGYRLSCVGGNECVFVDYNEQGAALCVIQKAYYEKLFGWEKPLSCHLYPLRLKKLAGLEYAHFEYVPELCSSGCANGSMKGIYLADFLEDALVRRYGRIWYEKFKEACKKVRNGSLS